MMDYETVPAADFGRALGGVSVNLLVRDVAATVAFLRGVFGMRAYRVSADFAIMEHGGALFQLHADPTYHDNPLPSLLPEAGPRGGGVEIRLHEADPDAACAAAAGFPGFVVLRGPSDRPHGLREAYLLSPDGYAFVPSRRLPVAT